MTKRSKHAIPSPGFVRFVAAIVLVLDVALLIVTVTHLDTLGWPAYMIILGTVATLYFPIKAMRTGDPEWILLDLILPV